MGNVLRELLSHWLGDLLGLDGLFCTLLLAGALWFGHYGFFARRPAERVVLIPISLACFLLAALVCGWTKYLVLLSLGVLSYFALLYGPASRSGRRVE
jgi:hypothetical protein